ncbi:MAG: hypothetical protein GX850_05130 [Clostridiaceae bacterium]|jgi:hypothetical protein|nr:hypothetical protein [Clostridiaceae bacterium]
MHPIQGKWKIIAHTSFGDLPSINDIVVEGDTFHGVMHDEKSGKDNDIVNGIINGNTVTFETSINFVVFTVKASLTGTLSDDGKRISGTAEAMGSKGTFEGEKIE